MCEYTKNRKALHGQQKTRRSGFSAEEIYLPSCMVHVGEHASQLSHVAAASAAGASCIVQVGVHISHISQVVSIVV